MADDGPARLPAPGVRAPGDWIAAAAVTIAGVVLGAASVWLAEQLTPAGLVAGAGLTLSPAVEWWRLAVLLPAPLAAGVLIAWRLRAAAVPAGWRMNIGLPLLALAVLDAVTTA